MQRTTPTQHVTLLTSLSSSVERINQEMASLKSMVVSTKNFKSQPTPVNTISEWQKISASSSELQKSSESVSVKTKNSVSIPDWQKTFTTVHEGQKTFSSIPDWQKSSASLPNKQKIACSINSDEKIADNDENTTFLSVKNNSLSESKDKDSLTDIPTSDKVRELALAKATTKLPTPPKVLLSSTFPYLVSSVPKNDKADSSGTCEATQTTPQSPDLLSTATTQHYTRPLSSNMLATDQTSSSNLVAESQPSLNSASSLETEESKYPESSESHPDGQNIPINPLSRDNCKIVTDKEVSPSKISAKDQANKTECNASDSCSFRTAAEQNISYTTNACDTTTDTDNDSISNGHSYSPDSIEGRSESLSSRFKINDRDEEKDSRLQINIPKGSSTLFSEASISS